MITVSVASVIAVGFGAFIYYQAFIVGPKERRRVAERMRLEAQIAELKKHQSS